MHNHISKYTDRYGTKKEIWYGGVKYLMKHNWPPKADQGQGNMEMQRNFGYRIGHFGSFIGH